MSEGSGKVNESGDAQSPESYFDRARVLFRDALRDFDRSVFDLHRHLDAVAEDFEQTGRALIRGDGQRHGGNDEKSPAGLKVGDKMPDGTVYAGISPSTRRPLYVMPQDAPLTMWFYEAQEYAAKLDACSHQDWRMPTRDELSVLFNNRAAIGGFKENVPGIDSWYLASFPVRKDGSPLTRIDSGVPAMNFYDPRGLQDENAYSKSSLRCVRG